MLILSIAVFGLTVASGVFAVFYARREADFPDKSATKMRVTDLPGDPATIDDWPGPSEFKIPLDRDRPLVQESRESRWTQDMPTNIILWVRVGITALAGPFVGYIIVSKSADASTKNFAFTTVGTILGYWLSATPK